MNDLQHYGVKGMKWGVRKERSQGRKIAKAALVGTGAVAAVLIVRQFGGSSVAAIPKAAFEVTYGDGSTVSVANWMMENGTTPLRYLR